MNSPDHATAERTNLLKPIVTLVIDYVRWTQLAPLVTVWAFALAMLAAMLVANYEDQTWDTLGAVFQWIAGLPLIGERFIAWMESLAGDDGSINLGGDDLKAAALKAWGLLSLAFLALSLIVNWLFGPFKPWSLKRKLGIAALCCLVLLAGFIAVYFGDPSRFNGPAGNWMLTFSGIVLILFVVNAWCLSVAYLLGMVRRGVEASSLGEPQTPQVNTTVTDEN